jgi:hypothetical protein
MLRLGQANPATDANKRNQEYNDHHGTKYSTLSDAATSTPWTSAALFSDWFNRVSVCAVETLL